MSKRIYYNVPCTLFRDYLKDDMHRNIVLHNVAIYSIYVEFLRLKEKESNEAKRFNMACNNMGFPHKDYNDVMNHGSKLFESGKGEAFCSIDSHRYWQQVNDSQSVEMRVLFLAWMALKSIIGNKSYVKANNAIWLSRMDGSSCIKKPFRKGLSTYSDSIERLNNHYQCRKLKALLWYYYGLSFYDGKGVRGFYFSLTLKPEELRRSVEQKQNIDVMSMYKATMNHVRDHNNHNDNRNGNRKDNHNDNRNGNLK